MDGLFSDHRAGLKIGATVSLILALGLYYAWDMKRIPTLYTNVVTDAEAHDGRRMRFPIWDVVAIEGPQRLRMSKNIRDIPVEVSTEGLKVGDTVSVVGHFRAADQVIVADIFEVHHHRRLKEALGILGFLLSMLAFPLGFVWRGRRLHERA